MRVVTPSRCGASAATVTLEWSLFTIISVTTRGPFEARPREAT
jgi:hypothetical protein